MRIAIVGASVRAAAESVIRAGHEVVAADLFADADLQAICPATRVESYPEGFIEWLRKQSVDGWLYTGALENYPAVVDQLATIAPLWGVSSEPLRQARDPLLLQRLFAEAGIAMPETRLVDRSVPLSGDWLAKTYRHSAGAGVWALDNADAWERAIESQAYAQRIAPGRSAAAIYAVGPQQAMLLGVAEQLVDPAWGYYGSLGPCPPIASLQAIGNVLCGPLALRGLIGVDLIVEGATATVIEINPRYTASVEVLERASGRSAIAAHLAACQGEPIEPWVYPENRAVAKRILFAPESLTISQAFHDWALRQQAEERLADVPHVGDKIEQGQPVCTLLAWASDTAQSQEAIQQYVVEAKSRLF